MNRKDFNNLLAQVSNLTNQQRIALADKMFGGASTDNYNQLVYYTDLEKRTDKNGRNRYHKCCINDIDYDDPEFGWRSDPDFLP